jgi:uncharacterized protein with gpF-like domain
MSSVTQQRITATKDKRKAQKKLERAIVPWIQDIIASYRIGDESIDIERVAELNLILRKFYNKTSRSVLGYDIREFKQLEEETLFQRIKKSIALQLKVLFPPRASTQATTISGTSSKWVERTSKLAIENGWGIVEAKRTLKNYLINQRLIIAVTESQWTVETIRNTAVIRVQDPLKNTMERLIQLIEEGNINAAKRLSRQVDKLIRLPQSVSQGNLIRTISDSRDRLTTPVNQARTIANLKKRGAELGRKLKKWVTIGDEDVRSSHNSANGQEKELDQPFSLAGGLVQYPGDASLGASLSEIIGCRCVSAYI